MNDSLPFIDRLSLVTLTYLLHSTVLYLVAWTVLRFIRVHDHLVRERIWKIAAVLGLFSVTLSLTIPGPLQSIAGSILPGQPRDIGLRSDAPINSALTVDRRLQLDSSGVESATVSTATHEMNETTSKHTSLPKHENADPEQSAMASNAAIASKTEAVHGMGKSEQEVGPINQLPGARPAAADTAATVGLLVSLLRSFAHLTVVVFALGGILLGVHLVRLTRPIPGCLPVKSGPLHAAMNSAIKEAGLTRRVTLHLSRKCREPLAYGLLRWTIVLPDGIDRQLTRSQLQALLAHELGHLVRGDLVWLLIGKILCTCLAFQPLNFLARKQWAKSAEEACDDWAVRRGAAPLDLAESLTRIVAWRLDEPVAGAVAASGIGGSIVRRVERLLDEGTPRRTCLGTTRSVLVLLPALALAFALAASSAIAQRIPAVDVAGTRGVLLYDASTSAPFNLPSDASPAGIQAELAALDRDLARLSSLLGQRRNSKDVERLYRYLAERRESIRNYARTLREENRKGGAQ